MRRLGASRRSCSRSQHTLKLADVTVRLTRPAALDDQTYKRSGTIVYTVPLQVHNGTNRPQRFPAPYRPGRTGQLVLQDGSHLYVENLPLERTYARGVAPPQGLKAKPGQILLLVTSFADAGKTTAATQGVIRFYK